MIFTLLDYSYLVKNMLFIPSSSKNKKTLIHLPLQLDLLFSLTLSVHKLLWSLSPFFCSHQTSVPSHWTETALVDVINSLPFQFQGQFLVLTSLMWTPAAFHMVLPLSSPSWSPSCTLPARHTPLHTHFPLFSPCPLCSSNFGLLPTHAPSSCFVLAFPPVWNVLSPGIHWFIPSLSSSLYSQTITSYNSLFPSPYFTFCQSLYQSWCLLI